MPVVRKDTQGYGYNYADLGSILKYVEEHLHLQVKQTIKEGYGDNELGYIVTSVKTISPYSEWSDWTAPVPIIVGDDEQNQKRKPTAMQKLGSAITYARRYSIQMALGLAATDDDGSTSGALEREIPVMSDDTKHEIDVMLVDQNVPKGQENTFLSNILRRQVKYATLSEQDAQTIINAYQKHKNREEQADVREQD